MWALTSDLFHWKRDRITWATRLATVLKHPCCWPMRCKLYLLASKVPMIMGLQRGCLVMFSGPLGNLEGWTGEFSDRLSRTETEVHFFACSSRLDLTIPNEWSLNLKVINFFMMWPKEKIWLVVNNIGERDNKAKCNSITPPGYIPA